MGNATPSHPLEEAETVIKVNDRRRFINAEPDAAGASETGASPAPAENPVENPVSQLQGELDQARSRIDELARAYQAVERDREDFKRRLSRERDQLLDIERGKIAVTLIEALDELNLCLKNAAQSPLATGVRLIRDNLLKKVESMGVERVELVGRAFDPNLAEATDMEMTATEGEDGRVTAALRECFQLQGRVIRPGQVRVARYVKPAQA